MNFNIEKIFSRHFFFVQKLFTSQYFFYYYSVKSKIKSFRCVLAFNSLPSSSSPELLICPYLSNSHSQNNSIIYEPRFILKLCNTASFAKTWQIYPRPTLVISRPLCFCHIKKSRFSYRLKFKLSFFKEPSVFKNSQKSAIPLSFIPLTIQINENSIIYSAKFKLRFFKFSSVCKPSPKWCIPVFVIFLQLSPHQKNLICFFLQTKTKTNTL